MKIVHNMEPGKPRSVGQTGKSRLALVILCVYWVGIFIASHIPKQHVPPGWHVSGKFLHLGAYFVLTLLVFINAGLVRRASLRSKKTWLMVGIIVGYAGLDELLQLFIPGRAGSAIDWALDITACMLCVGLLWLAERLRARGKNYKGSRKWL